MQSLPSLLKRLLPWSTQPESLVVPAAKAPPVPVNPDRANDVSWRVLLGGNGDICVCIPPFSASKPVKAAILVHRRPVASRYGPASPFVLAVRYEDGSSARKIHAAISQDTTGKVAGAPSVLVSESDETGIRHLYSAYVLHPRAAN